MTQKNKIFIFITLLGLNFIIVLLTIKEFQIIINTFNNISLLKNINGNKIKRTTYITGQLYDAYENKINKKLTLMLFPEGNFKNNSIHIETKGDGSFNAEIKDGQYAIAYFLDSQGTPWKPVYPNKYGIFTLDGETKHFEIAITEILFNYTRNSNYNKLKNWYEVKKEDTLENIAEKSYGNKFLWEYIYDVNPFNGSINEKTLLQEGDRLSIPPPSPSTISNNFYSCYNHRDKNSCVKTISPSFVYGWETGHGMEYQTIDQSFSGYYAYLILPWIKSQPNDKYYNFLNISSDEKHWAILGRNKNFKGGQRVIKDSIEGPTFDYIYNLFFSPDNKNLAYIAKNDGNLINNEKDEWFIVIDNKIVDNFDYISALAYTTNGTLYGIVKNQEKWFLWKDGKLENEWSYIDSLTYINHAQNIIYRAKLLEDNQEYWTIVIPNEESIFYDYVDQVQYDRNSNILTFRARNKVGKWQVVSKEIKI